VAGGEDGGREFALVVRAVGPHVRGPELGLREVAIGGQRAAEQQPLLFALILLLLQNVATRKRGRKKMKEGFKQVQLIARVFMLKGIEKRSKLLRTMGRYLAYVWAHY
jgi:hypothetical protein